MKRRTRPWRPMSEAEERMAREFNPHFRERPEYLTPRAVQRRRDLWEPVWIEPGFYAIGHPNSGNWLMVNARGRVENGGYDLDWANPMEPDQNVLRLHPRYCTEGEQPYLCYRIGSTWEGMPGNYNDAMAELLERRAQGLADLTLHEDHVRCAEQRAAPVDDSDWDRYAEDQL